MLTIVLATKLVPTNQWHGWTYRILAVVVTCLLVVTNTSSQPQRLEFEHVSVEQGLSHNAVTAILQDSRGFLWIGTRNGLNRYNGYSFVVFHREPQDPSSLLSDHILCLYEDHFGTVWVGTDEGGLYRYDWSSNKFRHYHYDPDNSSSLSGNRVSALYEDKSGSFWVGAEGLNNVDRATGRAIRFKHNPDDPLSIAGNLISFIYEDLRGNFWVGTSNGLDLMDRKTGYFRHFRHTTAGNSISSNALMCMYEGHDGTLWFGTNGGGLNRYNRGSLGFKHYRHDPEAKASLSNDQVSAIGEDGERRLWIGSLKGGSLDIAVLDQSGEAVFVRDARDLAVPRTLGNGAIRAIHRDRNGNMWIGTENGLNKVSPAKRLSHLLSGEQVTGVCVSARGEIWVGTSDGGIVVLDKNKNLVERFKHAAADPNSISPGTGYCLFEDRYGEMWVGTDSGFLDKYNRRKRQFSHQQLPPGSGPNSIVSLHGLAGKNLLVCTREETYVYNEADKRFEFKRDLAPNVLDDGNGGLWSFAGHGFALLDDEGKPLTHYAYSAFNAEGLGECRFVDLKRDHAGNIWAGSDDAGLWKIDLLGMKAEQFSINKGLANETVYSLLLDRVENIWIATENGLSRFDPRKETFRNYYTDDGLPTNSFSAGQSAVSRSGELLIGTKSGLVIFRAIDIKLNILPPPVVLTSFNVLHKQVRFDKDISEIKDIEITYREDAFSFEFAALDFTNSAKNQYAYTMDGFDDDWVYASTRRYTTYTNLYPGTYTFRVKGSNSDGVWNESGASVTLVIVGPVWMRWWFLTLVGLLIGGTLMYWYNWKVAKLLEVEHTRDRIARDLHDDIASTLGSVALYAASLRGNLKKPPKQTVQLLERIGSLSLEAIDAMGDIIWSTSPRNDTFNDLLIHMRDLTSEICTPNNIHYTTNINSVPQEVILDPEMRKNVYLIFKESINNIVKHAQANNVSVSAGIERGIFEMIIQDDGRGFNVEHSGLGIKDSGQRKKVARGHGLRSLEKRAKEIDAELTIKSVVGRGTTVRLVLRMT
jgi:ligand-binding sensor domain-containing protein/anti-sigma regulatory factor (Ser/Thr protein kinase)